MPEEAPPPSPRPPRAGPQTAAAPAAAEEQPADDPRDRRRRRRRCSSSSSSSPSRATDAKPEKVAKAKEAKAEVAKKAPASRRLGLEATGKSKCEEGLRLIQPRLSPDPSAPKDRVRNDLEAGLKLLNEGLEAYKKATTLAGKKYPIDNYRACATAR